MHFFQIALSYFSIFSYCLNSSMAPVKSHFKRYVNSDVAMETLLHGPTLALQREFSHVNNVLLCNRNDPCTGQPQVTALQDTMENPQGPLTPSTITDWNSVTVPFNLRKGKKGSTWRQQMEEWQFNFFHSLKMSSALSTLHYCFKIKEDTWTEILLWRSFSLLVGLLHLRLALSVSPAQGTVVPITHNTTLTPPQIAIIVWINLVRGERT